MPQLRDFQIEDFNAVLTAHQQHQSVLGRAATGLGKAVLLAALAEHYSQSGRVLVLVDVKKLVEQLAETIEWWTGKAPGIEMGESVAAHGHDLWAGNGDRIIVSTVQTQYSGDEGSERYRKFDPRQLSCLLLDETELFLAPKALSVVNYYREGNPNLKVFGTTATPFRSDGVAMINLFSEVAFNRDIRWGIDNGWLVPARQAFVQVSLDFETLKVKKNEDGEKDYSADEISQRINNEKTLLELSKGIMHVAEKRRSIVVCPDIATARALAHYLDAEQAGSARCIFGELGDVERDEIFSGHQRGEFAYLTSCSMLTKGYNDPEIHCVFNCRKTKSKRLYQQVLGRGTRPLRGIVDGLATAEQRKAAIASSAKPAMLMVNMVGVDKSVRDITVVDILGQVDDSAVVSRAKQLVEDEGLDTDEAVEQAQLEIDFERDVARDQAEAEAQALAEEEEAKAIRRAISDIHANVEVEITDDLSTSGNATTAAEAVDKRVSLLERFKYPAHIINKVQRNGALGEVCRKVMARNAKGMVVSWKQIQFLRHLGATDPQIEAMRKADVDAFVQSRRGEMAGAA